VSLHSSVPAAAGAPAEEKRAITDPLDPRGGAFLLSGNEALARAALVSHVGFAASYPGSPITETNEWMLASLKRHGWPAAQWSVNEHVALHAATGACWSGVRTLVTMKQVGLHVAADPAAYLAYAGVKGGLVLGVGTDPGANSSTGEFDVRWLAREMHWPLVEPATVQEVYEMALASWALSERTGLPVLFHMPAPLCHQVAIIEVAPLPATGPAPGHFVPDPDSFVNVGGRAVKNHARLLDRLRGVRAEAGQWHRIKKEPGHGKRGLIAAGIHYPLALELLRELGASDVPVLKLGLSYPLDGETLGAFAIDLDEALVLEELDGFLSAGLQMLAHQQRLPLWISSSNGPDGLAAGQLTYHLARERVATFLGLPLPPAPSNGPADLPPRPGTFCPGCSHRSPLMTIREILGDTGVYGGDIGCSSLPPHASDWLTCMGSGIGIAQGVAAVSSQKVIASIGDSTLFHAGLPAVLNAQQQGMRLVLVVLDNQYVAMTGHQPTASTPIERGGPPGGGQTVPIEDALRGLGVRDVTRVDAYNLQAMRYQLAQALGRPGLAVLVVNGECRLQFGRREPDVIAALPRYAIIPELCNSCGNCYEKLGCVAIHDRGTHLEIDPDACTRCGLCYQACTDKAIAPYHLLGEQK
jgi:indolepyruvate ferredoxin oxidoreductase alpha subunit